MQVTFALVILLPFLTAALGAPFDAEGSVERRLSKRRFNYEPDLPVGRIERASVSPDSELRREEETPDSEMKREEETSDFELKREIPSGVKREEEDTPDSEL